ncbi:MAG: hypothetical protein WD734_05145, partial [Dehalococcoidia bacterium]
EPAPTFDYQWQRCDDEGNNCEDIEDADEDTYTLQPEDEDARIRVVVTATNDEGSDTATSAATAIVESGEPEPPTNTERASISGDAEVGETLTASPGEWDGKPAPTFDYQWQRCDSAGANCSDIDGADETTYEVEAVDGNARLRVVVTATNSEGTETSNSGLTSIVDAVLPPDDDDDDDDNGGGGGSAPPPASEPEPEPGPVTFEADERGGQDGTSLRGRIRVDVPEGAVPQPTVFTIIDREQVATEVEATPPGTFVFGDYVGQVMAELDEDRQPIDEFPEPINVTFMLTPDDVGRMVQEIRDNGGDETDDDFDEFVVVYWDGTEWIALPTRVDLALGEVTAVTDHLTLFSLLRGKVEFEHGLMPYGLTVTRLTRVGAEPAAIEQALLRQGCDPLGIWMLRDGRMMAYAYGAPAWVNRDFPISLPLGTMVGIWCE